MKIIYLISVVLALLMIAGCGQKLSENTTQAMQDSAENDVANNELNIGSIDDAAQNITSADTEIEEVSSVVQDW